MAQPQTAAEYLECCTAILQTLRDARADANAHTDFGPLTLPTYNILARDYNKSCAAKKNWQLLTDVQYKKLADEAKHYYATDVRRGQVSRIVLKRARDTYLSHPDATSHHLDTEIARMREVYLCKETLDDYTIAKAHDGVRGIYTGTDYGVLIVFAGASVTLGGTAWVAKLMSLV